VNGRSAPLVARAHPFTPLVLAAAIVVLAFALPAPRGPMALYAATAALVALAGAPRALITGAIVCLPLWFFLFILHVALRGGDGLDAALAQGARLGAIATASAALLRSFRPSRFLDAMAVRGLSFHAAYLIVATLQSLPRLRARAHAIQEAQRARGLRLRGAPLGRLRALVPLTLPLMLGSLAEVDDRAMALETRGVAARRRTPLAPPSWSGWDVLACSAAAAALLLALGWRVVSP
jgi:energy-coupling factor transport system permease protein